MAQRPPKSQHPDTTGGHLAYLEAFNTINNGTRSPITLAYLKRVSDTIKRTISGVQNSVAQPVDLPDLYGNSSFTTANRTIPVGIGIQAYLKAVAIPLQSIAHDLYKEEILSIKIMDLAWKPIPPCLAGDRDHMVSLVTQTEQKYRTSNACAALSNLLQENNPVLLGNRVIFLGGTLAYQGGDVLADRARCMSYVLLKDITKLMNPDSATVSKYFLEPDGGAHNAEQMIRRLCLGLPDEDQTINEDSPGRSDGRIYETFMKITSDSIVVIIKPQWPARQYLTSIFEDLIKENRMPKAVLCEPILENDGRYQYGPDHPDPNAPIVRDSLNYWKKYDINQTAFGDRARQLGNLRLFVRPP